MSLPLLGQTVAPRGSSKSIPRLLRDSGGEAGLRQTLGGIVLQNLVWGVRMAKEPRAWASKPGRHAVSF